MKYRKMPKSEDQLSVLGFGCMRFPTTKDGKIDEEQSLAMLHEAYRAGVNYYDTAWGYHDEGSEPFVGKFLSQIDRDKVFVATKLPCWLVKTRADMDDFLEKQLKRLQTDHIDYYLLHALNKKSWNTVHELGVLDFLQGAKASGRIRHIGFSFHDDYDTFEQIVQAWDWDFTQIMLNYLDTEYQAGLKGMRLAISKNMGIISMEPLRGGKLAKHIPPEVEEVWKSAGNTQTPVERALSWVWNIPQCTLLLSGMSTIEQVRENIALSQKAEANILSGAEQQVYSKAREAYLSRIPYLCSECRYCMPCPYGVNIPANLGQYAEALMFEDKNSKEAYLSFIPEKMRANQCVECGECLSKCPQQIDIPKWMQTIKEFFKD
ncbi:MAG: aldo/keto reductase [Candidatus Cloacimonetes bacterium]|nr:aldo/keto reductase [Candidatus Cloacimonadota bacterium]